MNDPIDISMPDVMADLDALINPRTADTLEKEMDAKPHLKADIRHEAKAAKRETRDLMRGASAVQHIGRIPAPDEAFHLVTSGTYALWDMVPALIQLAGVGIQDLHIATLGFSRRNIEDMMGLMDRGKLDHVTMLCSHYFKGTSNGIWEFADAEFRRRPQTCRFFSIRTHCKINAARMQDGRTITIESSANLRSCKNIEQMTVLGDPAIYAFHVGWIEELFAQEAKP